MSPHYRHTQVGWVILGVVAAILAFVWSRLPPEAAAAARLPPAARHRPHPARLQRPDRRGGRRGDPPAVRDRPRAQAHPARRGEGLAGGPQPLVHRVGDPPGAGLRAVERVGRDAVELALASGRRFRVGTDEPAALAAALARAKGEAPAWPPPGFDGPSLGAASSAGSRSPWCSSRSWRRWARSSGSRCSPDASPCGRTASRSRAPSTGRCSRLPTSPASRSCRPLPRVLLKTNGFGGAGIAAGPLPGRGAGRRAPLRRGGLRAVRPRAPAGGLRRRQLPRAGEDEGALRRDGPRVARRAWRTGAP